MLRSLATPKIAAFLPSNNPITLSLAYFRFWKLRLSSAQVRFPIAFCSSNDSTRPRQRFGRNRQADLLRRLEIDDDLELIGPFHRYVGGLCPLENLIHDLSGAPEHL